MMRMKQDMNQILTRCRAVDPETPGTVCFLSEAGMMVRGEVKSYIMRIAWETGVSLQIQEDKRFFESTYFFTAKGKAGQLAEFVELAKEYYDQNVNA